jgi:hypothetical protein
VCKLRAVSDVEKDDNYCEAILAVGSMSYQEIPATEAFGISASDLSSGSSEHNVVSHVRENEIMS